MRQPLKRVGVHVSIQVVWSIANHEACKAGSGMIDPVHFLLAALTIVDDGYGQAAESLKLSPEDIGSVAAMAAECRALLEMTDEEVTAARRRLRQTLGGGEPLPLRKLIRSSESNYLFQKAARPLSAGLRAVLREGARG